MIKSIEVDSNYINGNWKPTLKAVKNKRIVLLGELNHGSKEIFKSRNDLIKSLNQELGFNVILFESGIGELIEINLQKKTLSPTEMTYGFFGGWRTDEFVELMDYIKSNNISISGFDVQRTGGAFEKILIDEIVRLNLDSDKYGDLEKRFFNEKRKLTNRQAVYDSVQKSTHNLIEDYKILKLSIKKAERVALNDVSNFVVRTIENRIKYLQYFLNFVKDRDWSKRWKERDFMMFSNIDWLLKTIYKNQKVIVIAHNFHISKFNKKEEVMGEFLKMKYDSEMYSIGVFAGGGNFSNNRGTKEKLKPISNDGLDIKHVIKDFSGKVGFLNIPEKRNKNSTWLFEDIIINDTFIDLSGSNKMTLSRNFDGLIFIDKISPPEKRKK
ncbi:erythromycin esterase family protein [Winogradskyella sp.]|uniref:erythromycin esterase family protein n=1 Tax=Winogradskyella sp. TaxID=1883156 RepID=UPI003BACA9C3